VALVYCEVCGVLIKGPQAHSGGDAPEGVICDGCFASRRAVVAGAEPATPDTDTMVQFTCCYCHSLLRLKAVAKRSRIKCPKCADSFYLHPDGRLESRLEGNTTAVIQSEALLRPTPSAGVPPLDVGLGAKTAPMRREEEPLKNDKTQPLSREVIHQELASGQQALLDALKPKKLEFLDNVPVREASDAAMVDTDAFEAQPKLELLPDSVGPGDAPLHLSDAATRGGALRPSEEDRVDLDTEGLRRKTAKYAQRQTGRPATGKKKRAPEEEEAAKQEAEAEAARKAEKEQKREERERRAAEAARKAQELESQQAKKSLGALSLGALCLLPALLALGLLSMTTRGAGFATRQGPVGDRMRDLGAIVDKGTRSLGQMVNPYLPDAYRLPGERPR
jgi:hypothetical protein